MRKLLDHIQESGELERYWNIVEKENDEARKAARKLEKERRRLEMGSDYEMSADEDDDDDESNANGQSHKKSPNQDDEYYSDDVNSYFEYIFQYDSEQEASKSVSKFGGPNEEEEQYTLPFNAVRYLG